MAAAPDPVFIASPPAAAPFPAPPGLEWHLAVPAGSAAAAGATAPTTPTPAAAVAPTGAYYQASPAAPTFVPSPAPAPAPVAAPAAAAIPVAINPQVAAAAKWAYSHLALLAFGALAFYWYLHEYRGVDFGPRAKPEPAPVVAPLDPVAKALGAAYRNAAESAPLVALDATATDTTSTTAADLIRKQRETLDAALQAAQAPIVAEKMRRFPVVATADVAAVRAFDAALAAGWRGGK